MLDLETCRRRRGQMSSCGSRDLWYLVSLVRVRGKSGGLKSR